jgi:hypothetical protein
MMIRKRIYSSLSLLLNFNFSQLSVIGEPGYRISLLSFLIFIFLSSNTGYSQDSYRRHFIIACDISGNCRPILQKNVKYQRALEDLFQNLPVNNSNGNLSVLLTEKQNNKLFFDAEKDEISFFQFNVSQDRLANLQHEAAKGKTAFLSNFTESFIKNTNISWSKFKSSRGPNIISFIFNTLNYPGKPSDISIPNLVYPLILDKVNSKIPAEEYILIVLSCSPPAPYSTGDLNIVKTMIRDPFKLNATIVPVVESFKLHIDSLQKQYVRTDYFNFSFNTDGKRNSSSGVFGYILTPKNITPFSASTAITIQNKIKLKQNGYLKNEFKLSPVKINFPKNSLLKPTTLLLTISKENEDSLFQFKEVIARLDNNGDWNSYYSDSRRLLIYNGSNSSYDLQGLKIPLKDINSKASLRNLRLKIEFITEYNPTGSNTLNNIFCTESILLPDNFVFVSYLSHIMYYCIIPLVILITIFALIIFSKTRRKRSGSI